MRCEFEPFRARPHGGAAESHIGGRIGGCSVRIIMQRSASATCVFCGRAIGPDEPTSGRPPMAAHAACADAALADDRHWDAVAGASPQPEEEDTAAGRPTDEKRRSAGCLTVAAIPLLALLALLLPLLGG
jgi:hypothetical protein